MGRWVSPSRNSLPDTGSAHAQKLMREHPELHSVEVWEASGFNNEKTFLRCFRSQTGMTPAAWKKKGPKVSK